MIACTAPVMREWPSTNMNSQALLRHSRGKLADAINWAPGAAQVAAATVR
jgi:hypothetical protein